MTALEQLKQIEERIEESERLTAWLYEQRRELINHLNLNKGSDDE